jgi:hypothetical protein
VAELRRVTALVDWDTARRVEPKLGNELRRLDLVFSKLRTAIAKYISSRDTKNVYRVNWRMYHGWHQGKTKTEDRRSFDSFALTVRSQIFVQFPSVPTSGIVKRRVVNLHERQYLTH